MEAPKALETLSDLRKLLAPIISKRSENIESLAISNRMSTLKFEIDQIPLHIKKQQMIASDDNAFLHGLNQIFRLFEGFIDERVLHPSISTLDVSAQEEPYPKIEALLRLNMRRSNKPTSFDLSQLLLLPETEEKSSEALQLVTSFNANNSRLVEAASRQNVSAIDSGNDSYPSRASIPATELNALNQSRECLTHLLDTLVKNIQTSECHFPHVAKLQVRDPVYSDKFRDEFHHKMFVSCCKFPNKWQETICRVVPHLPLKSPELKNVRSFCDAIRYSVEEYEILELFVQTQTNLIRRGSKTEPVKNHLVSPTVSLKEILEEEKPLFYPAQNVVLGLNLCQALLRMYKSGMQSKDWDAENIFFLFDEEYIREAYNPYFAISLLQDSGSDNAEQANPRTFPVLVNFAKLLLEIALGERIFSNPKLPLHVHLLTFIPEDEGSKVSDCMVADYVDAVRACLKAKKRRSGEEEDDEEVLNEEDQCRAVIFEAAKHLKNARLLHKPQKDLNEPLNLRFFRSVPGRSEKKQNHQYEKIPLVSSLVAPVENTKTQEYSKKSRESASPWLNTFKNLRMNKIGAYPKQRIKVAVLDTGVDITHPGIKPNVCGQKSFVSNDPLKDHSGHGTHIAGILVDLAEYVDLYIGQVFRPHESEDRSPIIEALRYARESWKVEMISLSFGFHTYASPDLVQQEIEACIRAGIIVFAAASNDAGNQPRTYPAKYGDVLCIHSATREGTPSTFNPSPVSQDDNFTFVGECVKSYWPTDRGDFDGQKGEKYRSGTSIATPVAVSVAVFMINYIRKEFPEHHWNVEPLSPMGMRQIFRLMAQKRGNYQFVNPSYFLTGDKNSEGTLKARLLESLRATPRIHC